MIYHAWQVPPRVCALARVSIVPVSRLKEQPQNIPRAGAQIAAHSQRPSDRTVGIGSI